jgi:hypothetical protein
VFIEVLDVSLDIGTAVFIEVWDVSLDTRTAVFIDWWWWDWCGDWH